MELKKYITVRKSTRSYKNTPVDSNTIAVIEEFIKTIKPLYPEIKTKAKIIERKDVKSFMKWLPPQVVAIYSEEKEGMYENAGFMFQQLDLYFHSIGLGSCWVGLGRTNKEVSCNLPGMKFVILLAFGYPEKSFRNGAPDFKRKSLTEISDISDCCLEPARLAPSAVNSQPWYFVSDGDIFHAYRNKVGLVTPKMLKNMNHIDMGIALCHMYVSNPDTFSFLKKAGIPLQKGKEYTGSFKI